MLIDELNKLEKIVNSELTSKIISSKIENEELKIEVESDELNNVIKFLKSDDRCKFRQLIDIAGVDKPSEVKRFSLIYLLLSHEFNLRVKILINFETEKKISSITKLFLIC